MDSLMETVAYRGYQIELHWDNDHDLDFVLCDEPCAVVHWDYRGYSSRGNALHDNCGRSLPGSGMIKAVHDNDADELAEDLGFERRDTAKRFGFQEDPAFPWHYYKSMDRLFKGMLYYSGNETMRVEEIRSQRETYFYVWYQDELDKYAGMKNAKPMLESIQSYFDGEVYGYVVKDKDGEDMKGTMSDSCWGFVGDVSYCLDEGKSAVDWIFDKVRELRQKRVKELLRNKVPLLVRQAELYG